MGSRLLRTKTTSTSYRTTTYMVALLWLSKYWNPKTIGKLEDSPFDMAFDTLPGFLRTQGRQESSPQDNCDVFVLICNRWVMKTKRGVCLFEDSLPGLKCCSRYLIIYTWDRRTQASAKLLKRRKREEQGIVLAKFFSSCGTYPPRQTCLVWYIGDKTAGTGMVCTIRKKWGGCPSQERIITLNW